MSFLCSVGGSQPIVFSYISEFFTEKQRGPMIIILASCWQPGIIFTGINLDVMIVGSSVLSLRVSVLAWPTLKCKMFISYAYSFDTRLEHNHS